MGELKPVPIWPGGSATAPAAPSPASSTTAPAPSPTSTSSPSSARPFGMPSSGAKPAAARSAPKPPAAPAKLSTPTGHPRDQWGQPWPGASIAPEREMTAFHPEESPGFPVAPQIGDRYRSGADTWILTPGGWRLMSSSRELPVGPSSSSDLGAFEAEKKALQAERDKHAEQARKLADLPRTGGDEEPRPGADDKSEHKPVEPEPELEHADSEHKNRSHRRHR